MFDTDSILMPLIDTMHAVLHIAPEMLYSNILPSVEYTKFV